MPNPEGTSRHPPICRTSDHFDYGSWDMKGLYKRRQGWWIRFTPIPGAPQIRVALDKELASLKDGRVAGQVRLDVEESKTGMDWFDLSVALQVTDTTLSTDEIALLLKSKGKWVKLQNKGWRKLEFDLTEAQLKELADLELAVNDFDGTQKQTVFAYRLIIKDSIEEKIRQLQKKKGDIANDILGEENFAEALTLNDFNFLLDGN